MKITTDIDILIGPESTVIENQVGESLHLKPKHIEVVIANEGVDIMELINCWIANGAK